MVSNCLSVRQRIYPWCQQFRSGVTERTEDEESLGGGMIAVTRVMDLNAGRVS